MSFPEWAPASLVREHNELKERASNERRMAEYDDTPHDDWSVFEGCCPGNRIYEADKSDRLVRILHELLTVYDMKAAWESLSRAPIKQQYEGRKELLLWDCITRSVLDFERMTVNAQTHAERNKNLKAIATKIKGLREAIAGHEMAAHYSGQIMKLHLSNQHIERQLKFGSSVDEAEWHLPGLRLTCDLEEARKEYDDVRGAEKHWADRPILERLSVWAGDANEASLDALLELFSECLLSQAERPSEIKQPGRGDDAFKAFLLRRLTAHMEWLHGQPLSDVVAILATIILCLDHPLTRDDIRPYIRKAGKKKD